MTKVLFWNFDVRFRSVKKYQYFELPLLLDGKVMCQHTLFLCVCVCVSVRVSLEVISMIALPSVGE